MTKQIGGELEEQNTILEEFDYEVADTQGRLSNATKFVDKLLENASSSFPPHSPCSMFVPLFLFRQQVLGGDHCALRHPPPGHYHRVGFVNKGLFCLSFFLSMRDGFGLAS